VDKDATILVVDRRLVPLEVKGLAVLNGQVVLGAIQFHTCKGLFKTVGNGWRPSRSINCASLQLYLGV